jgi:hypothetical protein
VGVLASLAAAEGEVLSESGVEAEDAAQEWDIAASAAESVSMW